MAEECASYEAMVGAHCNGAGQQQKGTSTTIQFPSLTSKPLKHQQAAKDNGNQNEMPPSGYYLNVAQKGKLILPTALWILLIVAGVSFLTLLASLNKAVNTLDTLIEMERDMDAKDMVHHLRDHSDGHHGLHKNKEEDEYSESSSIARHASKKEQDRRNSHGLDRLTMKERNDDIDDRWLSGIMPMKTSWFTFPSWTSLEPDSLTKSSSHSHHNHQSVSSSSDSDRLIPPQIGSIMSDMIRQLMGLAEQQGSAPEITGSLIISSTMDDGGNLQVSGSGIADRPPTGYFDSILRQIMPMLDDSRDGQSEPKTAQKSARREEAPSPGPIISAKIESLNINLNTENNDANKGGKPNTKTTTKRPAHYEREEMDVLEKSIDSMMSNLMEQKTTNAGTILVNLGAEESIPLMEPMDLISAHNKAKHHHHHHATRPEQQKSQHTGPLQSPLSPLASLLMPIGFGSPMMAFRSSEATAQADLPFMPSSLFLSDEKPTPSGRDNNKQHRYQHERLSQANSFLDQSRQNQPLEGAQLIISIASDEKKADQPRDQLSDLTGGLMDGLGDILRGSNSVLQAPGQSPYELPMGLPILSLLDSLKDFDQTIAAPATEKQEGHSSKRPLDEAQRLKEDAKWDKLAKDLAESMVESTLQGQLAGGGKGLGQVDQSKSILMMKDGKSLADRAGQNRPVSILFKDTISTDRKNTTEAEPSKNSTKDSHSVLENHADKSNMDNSKTVESPSSPLGELLTSSLKAQSGMPTKGVAAEITKSPTRDSNDSLLNEFFGNMFTLPQFEGNNGGSSRQQQASSGSGSSSSGGDSSSEEAEADTDNPFRLIDINEFPDLVDELKFIIESPADPENYEYEIME